MGFTSRNIFCSKNCLLKFKINSPRRITKKQILSDIRDWFENHKRVPYKNEYSHVKAARKLFGTWNNTILAAGYKPNPIKFALKQKAADGHMCDSLSEKIIDDWLYAKGIKHSRSLRYPGYSFSADFKVGEVYIEFFGLHGQLQKYDKLMKKKLDIIRTKGWDMISIYPKDLFPKNQLDKLLGSLKKH